MSVELSSEAEEYVEAIYRLQKRSGVAKTSELAKELNVVPGSITNTIEHLERHGLVRHEPYKGVRLTAEGEKLALDVLRRHRLAERLLTDILKAEWSEVHESACKLEHALSKDIVKLLERKLGHPRFCPHGNPIPTENGKIEEESCYPLAETAINETVIVAKITDEKRQSLTKFANIGIKPGAPIHIVKRKPTSMILCIAGKESSLSNEDVSRIWVRKAKAKR
ncbi:MAG: metal-dependent transcriptional regulator [Candidatus Bathyarchaeia archaeon]